MAGVAVVLNPRSRRARSDPALASRLARILGDRGAVHAPDSIEGVGAFARRFAEYAPEVLAVAGGDGTAHVLLTALLRAGVRPPPLVLLRAGTMNTVANGIGVPGGGPEDQLRRLLADREALAGNGQALTTTTRSLLCAGDHAGFLFGTGVVAGFLDEYYRAKEPSPVHAVRTFARVVGSALVSGPLIARVGARFEGTVTVDGEEPWPARSYLAVAAGTVDQMGLGFRPFHRSAEQPDTLHVLGIHATVARFVGQLPRVRAAKGMSPETAHEAVTRGATVTARGDEPFRYTVDGDLHECARSLRLTAGPRITFILPRA